MLGSGLDFQEAVFHHFSYIFPLNISQQDPQHSGFILGDKVQNIPWDRRVFTLPKMFPLEVDLPSPPGRKKTRKKAEF